MELDTVNAYSTIGMEGLSGEPWDCLFGSDSISDAFQGSPDMFHMDIRRCDNTGRIGWHGSSLGFNFDDVLTETDEDPVGFNDKSRSSNSNLEELNLDSDSELALTLDPNLVLPRNMSMPIRSPESNSEAAILETVSVEENVAENEGEETENESEAERTENDEENESEEEEEVENEHNETEYETEEEETEEEEEDETEDDEQDTTVQRSLTPSSVEAPTSISSSSAGVGARTLAAVSSPTIQLTRVQMQHPKISTVSGTIKVQDIKMLAANPGGQASHHIRKQIYNNNVHDVGPGATTVMIQAAKREKELMAGHRDNSYPKPAYSYSCLIAMALKNSRAGSLPVSEIYNFMCRHFPYFKTAPTGWKNSVRHNLSLNKCFEKIEKPPGNGSQRKGCLWAIHPSKVAKMDEEVRKWSRKDPTAIKRAMVHPEHLELLERGEMKYEGDRHEEIYEDAESYADSETGGSAVDETINDDENVTYDETKHIDIVDNDIVVEHLYEDLDLVDAADLLDTRLNDFPRQERSVVYELVSCAKRQKTLSGSPIQSDYVYQQVDAASPRRKAHIVALRSGTAAGSGSLLETD